MGKNEDEFIKVALYFNIQVILLAWLKEIFSKFNLDDLMLLFPFIKSIK